MILPRRDCDVFEHNHMYNPSLTVDEPMSARIPRD